MRGGLGSVCLPHFGISGPFCRISPPWYLPARSPSSSFLLTQTPHVCLSLAEQINAAHVGKELPAFPLMSDGAEAHLNRSNLFLTANPRPFSRTYGEASESAGDRGRLADCRTTVRLGFGRAASCDSPPTASSSQDIKYKPD